MLHFILNLKGHQNPITSSRVMAILLNWLILPIGGGSAVEGLLSMWPTLSIYSGGNINLDTDITKVGRSFHFPEGTGCKSWFFVMSAGTKLIIPPPIVQEINN